MIATISISLLAVFDLTTDFVETALYFRMFAVCAWNGMNMLTLLAGNLTLALLPSVGGCSGG